MGGTLELLSERDSWKEKSEALETVIIQAIKAIENAEYGEGYQFNLPFILSDLKKAVNKDYKPNPPFMLSDLKEKLKNE